MKAYIATITVLLSLNGMSRAEAAAETDVIHFVYELTRHGARAPTESEYYKVGPNMLTAEGMRQRFLLGANNRKKYTEDYKLIDLEGDLQSQVHMEATNVNRTIQSGYSELMGFLPPLNSTTDMLNADQVQAIATGGISSPPFNIRDESNIEETLGNFGLPNGFTQIPIYNYMNQPLVDDLDMGGCEYVSKVDGYRFPSEDTYTNVEYLKADLYLPISQYWGLDPTEAENMSFMDLYGYCDQIQSNLFEGLNVTAIHDNFTQTQLDYVNQTALATLCLPMAYPEANNNSRNMYVSKQIREPLAQMAAYVNNASEGWMPLGKPQYKFLAYSTHDWTVSLSWLFFNATNGNFTNVPFASQFVMELHSTDGCQDESCFWVEVYQNNALQMFEEHCTTRQDGSCTYTEFRDTLLPYLGGYPSETSYKTECAKPFTPPSSLEKLLFLQRVFLDKYSRGGSFQKRGSIDNIQFLSTF